VNGWDDVGLVTEFEAPRVFPATELIAAPDAVADIAAPAAATDSARFVTAPPAAADSARFVAAPAAVADSARFVVPPVGKDDASFMVAVAGAADPAATVPTAPGPEVAVRGPAVRAAALPAAAADPAGALPASADVSVFPEDARLEADVPTSAGVVTDPPDVAFVESPDVFACAAVPAAVAAFGDELDVIAAFRGTTTAATSGGNSCVSKRGSQK
jgi:hypothetical protein